MGLPGLAGANFGTTGTNSGTLTVAWDDPSGTFQSLSNGAVLFYVRFQLLGSNGQNSQVYINGTPTDIEAADEHIQIVPVSVVPGTVSVGPQAPRLRIAQISNNQVIVAWPTNFAGFVLQSRPELATDAWVNVPGLVSIVGNEYTVTNSMAGNRFYRLIQGSTVTNPELHIKSGGAGFVILSWSTNSPGFTLQSRTSVATGNWSDVVPSPTIVGQEYSVTNASIGNRFYRLVK